MVIAFLLGTLWFLLLVMVFHVLFGGVGRVLRRRRRKTTVTVDLPLSRRSPD
ncbi:MAG: hypothetical protein HOV68_13560 [Streptomycetaceae bacterium]|nr:hypothetical protein [Streptomycetaceae bacterium]